MEVLIAIWIPQPLENLIIIMDIMVIFVVQKVGKKQQCLKGVGHGQKEIR